MNLICYICEKEIIAESRIAKIISIKRVQQNKTDASVEYSPDQEEIYIHFNCLQTNIIPCLAKHENFAQNPRIIDNDTTLDSLVRSNILNF